MGTSTYGSPCSEPEHWMKQEVQCNKRKAAKMDRTAILNLGKKKISTLYDMCPGYLPARI